MSSVGTHDAKRPQYDAILVDIADYVLNYRVKSRVALNTARYALMDSIGCGLLALNYPACTTMLGPVVPGMHLNAGTPVPGTAYALDPVQAAFNISTMVRWLDYNDTWLAAEWGHPSDNLGAVLSVADYISRRSVQNGEQPLTMRSVLESMIKAYEIQGILSLENSFNRVGLDHVMLVRIASAAIATHLLGGSRDEIINAVSHAWIDGCALRTYRHAPNTGSRKSWAAGDAASRGVRLGLIALKGEMGYPSAITAKAWGFQDVLYSGKKVRISQPFGTYVMENILFKISFPAEFHAQTAVEAAIILYPEVNNKLDQISRVEIETQEAGIRIIDKKGPLDNPADRDHCIQYMVAVSLIKGKLEADDYEDEAASDPRIDDLRKKMTVTEKMTFSEDYMDPKKRSIGNSVQVFFKDGSKTQRVAVDYPIGHRRRRKEGLPLLIRKFRRNMSTQLSRKQCNLIDRLCSSQARLEKYAVNEFLDLFRLP